MRAQDDFRQSVVTENIISWSNRNVFVFGPAVIDLQRERFRFGPVSRAIRDCSDAEYYCITGGLSLVLPRRCQRSAEISGWDFEGNAVRIAARVQRVLEPHEGPPNGTCQGSLLFSENNRSLLYHYEYEAGVVAIYLDPTFSRDLVEAVRAGAITGDFQDQDRFDLITLDPFGPCLTM